MGNELEGILRFEEGTVPRRRAGWVFYVCLAEGIACGVFLGVFGLAYLAKFGLPGVLGLGVAVVLGILANDVLLGGLQASDFRACLLPSFFLAVWFSLLPYPVDLSLAAVLNVAPEVMFGVAVPIGFVITWVHLRRMEMDQAQVNLQIVDAIKEVGIHLDRKGKAVKEIRDRLFKEDKGIKEIRERLDIQEGASNEGEQDNS